MKNKFRKVLRGIAILTTSILLSAYDSSGSADDGTGYTGVAMPTRSAERWIANGNNMISEPEKLGYKIDLQYGEDKIENQVAQIEGMITKRVDTLVIASVDGSASTSVLARTKEADIKVIAYDRLLMNSENVDHYATFDSSGVGVSQAACIEEHLGLKEGEGPLTIELLGNSPDDNNALINYNEVMSALQPYMDNGQLIVPSGQTSFSQIAMLRWDGSTAQARMNNLLNANYTDQTLGAVLSPYDPISLGIISSLKGVGYRSGSKSLPIITGQDTTVTGVKPIIAGRQIQTIFKGTRILTKNTIETIKATSDGEEVPTNDTETHDNEVKTVPAYLASTVPVDRDSYQAELIDTDYYKKSGLKN